VGNMLGGGMARALTTAPENRRLDVDRCPNFRNGIHRWEITGLGPSVPERIECPHCSLIWKPGD
jgi:hypothetical protein